MIVIGVDPGTLITGYGVIQAKNGRFQLLEYDVIRNSGSRSMPLRLKSIYSTLCEVINRHHPDEFAIESAFYGKNAQSALKIGHARGVAILAAVNFQIPSAEYAPRAVKKAVVGIGSASKEQVQAMVKTLLRMKRTPEFFDATDALAVAICHVQRRVKGLKTQDEPRNGKSRTVDWKAYIAAHPERVTRRP